MLTCEQLQEDLHKAYLDARRNKRTKPYQQLFESNLEKNLEKLCDELWTRTYHPGRSTCFLISEPKLREVFAAQFRDRIVHHLYYNYTHAFFEKTFIYDSYSCIKHRGTHFGINRLESHIRQESHNWTWPCYVLKMDIQGYFMHINRQKLLEITLCQIYKMARRGQDIDVPFIEYLSREIISLNPMEDCDIHGNIEKWSFLPRDKSLFYSEEGCGLPIGNLTSQLFSNVYLNELDQFMKRKLHCQHYGRYVDDFYVVSTDRQWLRSLIPKVRDFLWTELRLKLHEGKLRIYNVRQGVDFLGAFLKPHRRYVSNASLRRMKHKLLSLEYEYNPGRLRARLNSYFGILGHYRSKHIQMRIMSSLFNPYKYGFYTIKKNGFVYKLNDLIK